MVKYGHPLFLFLWQMRHIARYRLLIYSEIRDVQASVATNGANGINNLTAIQANMQNYCCTTQRAIDGGNYNLASESAA